MSKGQRIRYVFLGVIIGIFISAGILLSLLSFAPEYLVDWSGILARFTAKKPMAGQQDLLLDQTMLKGIIQDILTSEQGKALVNDLIRSQTPETLQGLLKEIMDSPEFKIALGEALELFLNRPEGNLLIRRIAQKAITQ